MEMETPEVITRMVRNYQNDTDKLYSPDRQLAWDIQWLTTEKKNLIDKWLVSIQHPLAYEPGTQEQRVREIVKEMASQKGA